MSLQYRAGKDSVTGHLALFAREKEGLPFNGMPEFPLAILTSSPTGFPLDPQKLAENMADLLNHRAPSHRLASGDKQVFYNRTGQGVILRTRDEGVSVPALSLTISSKSSVADLGQALLTRMSPDFMKRVCDMIVPESALSPVAQQKGPAGPAAKL